MAFAAWVTPTRWQSTQAASFPIESSVFYGPRSSESLAVRCGWHVRRMGSVSCRDGTVLQSPGGSARGTRATRLRRGRSVFRAMVRSALASTVLPCSLSCCSESFGSHSESAGSMPLSPVLLTLLAVLVGHAGLFSLAWMRDPTFTSGLEGSSCRDRPCLAYARSSPLSRIEVGGTGWCSRPAVCPSSPRKTSNAS